MKYLCVVSAVVLFFTSPDSQAQMGEPLTKASTTQLIDLLREIRSFDAFDRRMRTINLGWPPNQRSDGVAYTHQFGPPSPIDGAEELVKRGVDALPALIAHLGDARKSGALVEGPMALEYSNEFDRNPRTDNAPHANVAAHGSESAVQFDFPGMPQDGPHALAVGDLCFTIIGRIVNREFDSGRGVPEGVGIVNSPLVFPAVRSAVIAQWGHLTKEQLRQSLINDVVHPDNALRAVDGLWILYRYFPTDVPASVRDRFSLPYYDWAGVREFVDTVLYVQPDPARRKQLLANYLSDHGPAFRDGVILRLWEDRNEKVGANLIGIAPSALCVAPSSILRELVGSFDPDYPPPTSAASNGDLEEFLPAVGCIRSKEVSAELFKEFQRFSDHNAKSWTFNPDWLAQDCLVLIAHQGYDDSLRSWYQRRIKESPDETDALKDSLDALSNSAKTN